MTYDDPPAFNAANRTLIIRPFSEVKRISTKRLEWAKKYQGSFSALIDDAVFSAAMRCYGNAQYLYDEDAKIMLLWSGIEGLLSVEAELSRRLALYAALLHQGTSEEKSAYFQYVKKAYGIRSRAVHGGATKKDDLIVGYSSASEILSRLLARCVELGRVPTAAELDALSVTPQVVI